MVGHDGMTAWHLPTKQPCRIVRNSEWIGVLSTFIQFVDGRVAEVPDSELRLDEEFKQTR
jgi:hypothetical protein